MGFPRRTFCGFPHLSLPVERESPMMKSSLYFAKTPHLQDLCTVVVKLAISNNQETPTTFKVQPQIIKCRELIFLDGRIIATPSLQEKTHIYVVLQQSYWKTGQFQGLCKKLGLEFMKPVRVISSVFQSCFTYTLTAKLAPQWNKVGEFYINGRDFLSNPGPLPAVNLDLNVTEAEICLALKGFGVYLPEPSLCSLNICESVLAQFQTNRLQTIPEFAIQEKWSHVLPSMKKGKVISVTHSIPLSSPFKRYKEMRRYWKNAYGYRLPEEEDDMFYFNVHFPMIGNNVFTYPSLCVRRSEPCVIPRISQESILSAFLRDVKSKISSVCGLPLNFCEEASYTKGVMAKATLQVHLLSDSITTQQSTRWMPTRSLSSIPVKFPQVAATSMKRCSSQPETPLSHRMGSGVISGNESTDPNQEYSSQQAAKKPFTFQNDLQNDTEDTRTDPVCKKTVPMFEVHRSANSQRSIAKEPLISHTASRIIPTFKSRKSVLPKEKSLIKSKLYQNKVVSIGKQTLSATALQSGSGCSSRDSLVKATTGRAWNSKKPANGLSSESTSLLTVPANRECDSTSQVICQPPPSICAPQEDLQSCSQSDLDSMQWNIGASRTKRKLQVKSASHKPAIVSKKQRLSPINNQHIELLAISNQLHKVNATTLSTWLRSKDIQIKSREKKADLVEKVMDYIEAQKAET
ncbi:hypothetical protein BSL78_13062 [Apostichopus japonicus]|uniref:DUF4708 domain-containing protein n=1 Tax=Stichopus japonicus TaxID=307972 RepID=A0A2G8KPW5_STIJA|nr:hypothetical protein BSL78_13062 [Apostichopus japonicus]